MDCPKCGAKDQSGKFCSECGAQLQQGPDKQEPTSAKPHPVKICPNCGDMLLPQAKKCPTCGTSVKQAPVLDRNNTVEIESAISQVPHPKSGVKPKWQASLDAKEALWSKEKQPPKRETARDRIKENKAHGVACCPKCGSTSLSANKKGFGIGKAAVGMALTGGLFGAVAGNIGAKKVWVTCLNCGHRWKI